MRFPAMIFSRCGRPARCAAIAAMAFAAPVSTAHAGFFDFLFAPPPIPQSPYPAYPGGMAHHWRGEPHFHRHRAKVVEHHHHRHIAVVEKVRHAAAPHVTPTGIMDDDSLQDGDAVMTQRGIRIFTGYSGSHHKPEEFARLSEIKGLPNRERTALAAIDANRSESGDRIERRQDVVTGRSAADPGVAVGAMITDPKGRMIRYVGP